MKLLLDKGCNKTCLIHYAIAFNKKKCLELLIEYHANPNELDDDGATPLFACLKFNLLDFAKFLIQNGADPSIPINIFAYYFNY